MAAKMPVAASAASGRPAGSRPSHAADTSISALAMPPPRMKAAASTKNGTAISDSEFIWSRIAWPMPATDAPSTSSKAAAMPISAR